MDQKDHPTCSSPFDVHEDLRKAVERKANRYRELTPPLVEVEGIASGKRPLGVPSRPCRLGPIGTERCSS